MLFHRMLRAVMLDQRLYDELRRDPIALAQALTVVLAAAVATAVGTGLDSIIRDTPALPVAIGRGIGIMPGLWLLQAASAFIFGMFVLDAGQATKRAVTGKELLTAVSYSAAPGVLLCLVFVPGAGVFAGALVFTAWMPLATVVAIRATLGVSVWRALTVVGPGFLARFLIIALVGGGASAT